MFVHWSKREQVDFDEYKIKFRQQALDSGYSETNIVKCLNYAEQLSIADLPIIYNTTHLSSLVGYKVSYLKRAVKYTDYFYREFTISKRNGRPRQIFEPLPSLKFIQRWILRNILYNVPISNYAKAYFPKRKFKQNLYWHRNRKIVLTTDIENFFSSIKLESIEIIFESLGYSNKLANLFAKLCTKDSVLPQGAPSSPALSNILMKPFDDVISGYCKNLKIKYTRYADDLSFSGDFDFKALMDKISFEISKLELSINKDKTKIMTRDQAQIVTGVVVNEKLQVPLKIRNQLRQDMYYINKFGVIEHMKRRKIKKTNYINHLLGRINFVVDINPEDKEFIMYRRQLIALLKSPTTDN